MHPPSRLIGFSVVMVVLILLAGGIYLRIGRAADKVGVDETAAASGGGSDVPATSAFSTATAIPVSGASVVRDTLVISVSAAAEAAAAKRAALRAQVQGRVTRIHVGENHRVGGGRLLIEIDPTEYELAVAKAEAALARAQAEYRELTLFDDEIQDSVVRAERDRVARAKSGLDEGRVSLQEAQLRLQRTRVSAPFAGRVANIEIVEGQWVGEGDELLTVVDLEPIRVEVKVLESEVALLTPGRGASVRFAAYPGETFTGRIATINPVVERDTRTARVTVNIPNSDGRILPGMYARVSLEARQFPDRILVPRAAVLERDRRTMLFVFEGESALGLAKWRYVTTGLANDSVVEIVENPETEMVGRGEIVLTDGHYTLIHDAQVRLVGNVRAEGGRPR